MPSGVQLWDDVHLYFDTPPASIERVSVPAPSEEWQLYQFRVTMDESVQPNGGVLAGFRMADGSALPSPENGDIVEFDDFIVSLGSEFPSFGRSPQDDLRAESVGTLALSPNAATDVTEKMVATNAGGWTSGVWQTLAGSAPYTFIAKATGYAVIHMDCYGFGYGQDGSEVQLAARMSTSSAGTGGVRVGTFTNNTGLTGAGIPKIFAGSASQRFDTIKGSTYTINLDAMYASVTSSTGDIIVQFHIEFIKR